MLDSLEKSPGPRWSDWGGIKLLQFARLLRGGTEGEGGTQLGRVASKGDIGYPVVMVYSLNASILSQNVLNSSKFSPDMMKRGECLKQISGLVNNNGEEGGVWE